MNVIKFGETLTDNADGNTEPSYYYNCKNLVTSGPHTLMVNHELRTVIIIEGVETGRQLPKSTRCIAFFMKVIESANLSRYGKGTVQTTNKYYINYQDLFL